MSLGWNKENNLRDIATRVSALVRVKVSEVNAHDQDKVQYVSMDIERETTVMISVSSLVRIVALSIVMSTHGGEKGIEMRGNGQLNWLFSESRHRFLRE